MAKKQSAGILLYRMTDGILEVLLVHPGGPLWAKKDVGAWSIPKGEFDETEDPFEAALREYREEVGQAINGKMIQLSPIKQKSGKVVYAWAAEGNIDPKSIKSNTFELEWPPRSGKKQRVPEIDKAEWFSVPTAKTKINKSQSALIDELITRLNLSPSQIRDKPNKGSVAQQQDTFSKH